MNTFRTLLENTIKENGIIAKFDVSVDTSTVQKLLKSYDTDTWAIDSFQQQKEANAYNDNIIKTLKELGSGTITYKTGPSRISKKITF